MQSPQTFQLPSAPLLVVLAVLVLLVGCGSGSGQGLDENGNLFGQSIGAPAGGGGGGVASGNPNATLAWVQSNVFGNVNLCSLCHIGAGAPLGLNWSSTTNTCANVGRVSVQIPQLLEIASGNPDASYVIWKVVGAGPRGPILDPIAVGTGQMPLGGTPLTAGTIQNMRDWIADGVPGCP